MYCASCGTQISTDLTYCNRCGFYLRETEKPNAGVITVSVSAITIAGIIGLLVMFFGALLLKKADFREDFIGFFVFFSFLLVCLTEFLLFRNLSKFAALRQEKRTAALPSMPPQNRLPQGSPLGEPVGSVTENTTRTLEYARREQ
jgi:hypothetical protein